MTKPRTCLDSALRMLAKRRYSQRELNRKLIECGYTESAIEAAMEDCARWGYLDDREYALSIIRQLNRKGYGPGYIRRALTLKGLSTTLVDTVVQAAALEENEFECCRRAMIKKAKTIDRTDPGKQRNRISRFLFQRGFSSDVIYPVIEEYFSLKE